MKFIINAWRDGDDLLNLKLPTVTTTKSSETCVVKLSEWTEIEWLKRNTAYDGN